MFLETRDAAAAIAFTGNVTPAPPAVTGSVNAPFLIGDINTGTVSINSGSALSVNGGNATVGDDPTGYGVLSITGANSSLTTVAAGSDLVVGNQGIANVFVDNFGGININDDLLIGVAATSSGIVGVDGLGSYVDANDTIHVGQAGEGVIEVTSAARVFADDTVIGTLSTGDGRVTISGLQSAWKQTNALTLGDAGRGTLEVFDKGRMETTNAVLGNAATGAGFVDVSGAGSAWEITGFITVGVNGEASMNILNGGRITTTASTRVASQTSGEGHVHVSGQESRWAVGGFMTVGDFGYATLRITEGGRVTAGDNVILGDNTNARGEATVDGEGSTWEITGTLDISQPGEGKLTISKGGLVTATGVARVAAAGQLILDGGRLASGAGSGLINNGLVRGDGTIAAAVSNTSIGEIRVAPGEAMVMHSTLANAGLVEVDGGELEVLGATTNSLDIDVRNGILRFQGGLTNTSTSQLAMVGGVVDIFGAVTNASGGQVVVGGQSLTAFHDTFTNNGSLLVTPGSELLTLESLSFNGSGAFAVQLADTDLDGFGQVNVGSTAAVAGSLQVELIGGFMPAAGDSFQIITAGRSRTGEFTTELLPSLGNGLNWNVEYNTNSVVLSVVGPDGINGDYNNDQTVDAADYVVWRKFNNTSMTLPNDPTAGQVNDSDYNVWRAQFGQNSGGGTGGGAVPEPSAVAGFAILATLLGLQRRQIERGKIRGR